MAGSAMTFTVDREGPIKRLLVAWTSDDTTGAVSATTTVKLIGYLLRGVTDPSATAPTANYDITLTDDEGVNVLGNCQDNLIDRHTSTTESVPFFLTGTADVGARPCVCSTLTVAVAAAGNSKLGQIILYLDGEILGNV